MSPCISGIPAAVRSGLAVAPVALSVAGEEVKILGPENGFPILPITDVCLYRTEDVKNPLAANWRPMSGDPFLSLKKLPCNHFIFKHFSDITKCFS